MTTIKVNERTKAGKAFLELAKLFSNGKKGIEIIAPDKSNQTKDYPISKNIPNDETLRIFKENDKEERKGLKKFDTAEELFEDLGI